MNELRGCPGCKRHVRVGAATCPFCAASLPAARAQYSKPRALTRAAIFSAALAGCSDHKQPAPSAAGSAQVGSDDLEKMLDSDGRTVQHASPPDAAADAPVDASAVAVDAALPPDAGAVHKKRHVPPPPPPPPPPPDDDLRNNPNWHNNPKPYGAPPARRRVV